VLHLIDDLLVLLPYSSLQLNQLLASVLPELEHQVYPVLGKRGRRGDEVVLLVHLFRNEQIVGRSGTRTSQTINWRVISWNVCSALAKLVMQFLHHQIERYQCVFDFFKLVLQGVFNIFLNFTEIHGPVAGAFNISSSLGCDRRIIGSALTFQTPFGSRDTLEDMAFDWEVIVGVEITGVEKCDMVVAGTGFDTDWVTVKQGADTEQSALRY